MAIEFLNGIKIPAGEINLKGLTIERASGSGTTGFDNDALGSYILSPTDGGWGPGEKPSGSHNGVGVISFQTHSGNYYTQLALSTNTNDLFIRSANASETFGDYSRLWNDSHFSTTNVTNWNTAYTHSQATHAPTDAEANVQSDWNATSGDALILNKPTIPSGNSIIDWTTDQGSTNIHANNIVGYINSTEPNEPFNPFAGQKFHDGVLTNALAGRHDRFVVTIDGTTETGASLKLSNQNFEEYNQNRLFGSSAGETKVFNINVQSLATGSPNSNGITYSNGFFDINFYSTPFPASWSARVKNKDGNWTTVTSLNKIGSSKLRGVIPIGNWLTDIEFTLTARTSAPFVTGNITYGISEFELFFSRMAASQGGNISSIGGYLGGVITTASGTTSTNWNSAYGWGDHDGLYLPIGGGDLTGDLTIDNHTPRIDFKSDQSGSNVGGRIELNENGNLWVNAQGGKDLWLNWYSPNSESSKADLAVGDGDTGGAILFVDGSERKVGINDTTPSEALDVNGNIAVTGTVDGVNISALPTSFAPTDAEANVQVDWDETTDTSDAYIKNKPTVLHPGQLYRQTGANDSASIGPGWITVAKNQSSRRHGEVIVSDSESSDHAFIRIDWMRSYADSNFSVLNVGGHANRITGVRVLSQDSDDTYGWKYLQVYVTVASVYGTRVHTLGTPRGYTNHTSMTPILENTKTGYSVHGNALEDLDTSSLAAEEGLTVGGDIAVGGTVDGVDISALPTSFAPTDAEANVQADWNATTGDALILNKPTIPTVPDSYAPTDAEANVQADWTETTTTSDAFILNKPSTFAPSAHNQAWSTITSTPTTLGGYGITDSPNLHEWEWYWVRYAGNKTPTTDTQANWEALYKSSFIDETATEQDEGYVNTINDVGDDGGFGGSTYGNIFGNLSSYHTLITTNIHVTKPFTVSITDFVGDDSHAIFIDGAYVKGVKVCCSNSSYSYTFTQGWHRIDLIYGEGGGGDYIKMGWNPKDYTDNISHMYAHLGADNPNYTLERLKGIDGTGSGLDSDLLDGQEGTYYLDYDNFSNTPTIPTVPDSYAPTDAEANVQADWDCYVRRCINFK